MYNNIDRYAYGIIKQMRTSKYIAIFDHEFMTRD